MDKEGKELLEKLEAYVHKLTIEKSTEKDKEKIFYEAKLQSTKVIGHPLSDKSEYEKELYLTILCAVAFADNEIKTAEMIFLLSILNGIEITYDISKYILAANNIDSKTIREFATVIKRKKLDKIFFVDSLLLAICDGEINDKEGDLLGDIAEILELKPNEIEELSNIAAFIISPGKNIEIKEHSIINEVKCYVKTYINNDTINDLSNGIFIIDHEVIIKQEIEIKNAFVLFNEAGKLIIETGRVTMKNSYFVDGYIGVVSENGSLVVENCNFKNTYIDFKTIYSVNSIDRSIIYNSVLDFNFPVESENPIKNSKISDCNIISQKKSELRGFMWYSFGTDIQGVQKQEDVRVKEVLEKGNNILKNIDYDFK